MSTTTAIDWGGGVSSAWNSVAAFIPKLVVCLIILVIGYLIAKAIEKILDRVLQRLGFDRLIERGGVRRALANSQYDAAGILGRIVFYAIMLAVLSVAFGVFGNNPISNYLHAAVAYLPRVFVAVVIVIVAAAIANGVRTLIDSAMSGIAYGRTLGNIAAFLIIALGVVAALDQLAIARNVVNAVLYAALATLVGVIVVAVGGGGIRPMQDRWRNTLDRYDTEKARMIEQARARREQEEAHGYGQEQLTQPVPGERSARAGAQPMPEEAAPTRTGSSGSAYRSASSSTTRGHRSPSPRPE